jgi:hypothetical protein
MLWISETGAVGAPDTIVTLGALQRSLPFSTPAQAMPRPCSGAPGAAPQCAAPCITNNKTDTLECFYNARELIYGPFTSSEEVLKSLKSFIKSNIDSDDDGEGRSDR